MMMLRKKQAVAADQAAIDRFLSRGIENVFPAREAMAKALGSGRRLSIYLGIDPTGPTLHMGHAIPLMKLGQLQQMGHRVILLIGDFTAMIGDPTDKMAARKQLTRKEVLANCKLYKKQASKFLSFSGANSAKLMWNSKWLAKMTFADIISLASNMTVQQMLERDMFEKRMTEKKPIHLHEFLYPLMQGYDSVAMDVDAEIGGNDQTFNMLAGRDLMKTLKGKDKFVLATRLLVDPSGKKMGKTEGNMIALSDSAADMFGKVMSWPDGMIISGFELCTNLAIEEISKHKAFLDGGGNPRDAKMALAHAITELYHGAAAADKAQQSFIAAFSAKGTKTMPADTPEVVVTNKALLSEVLTNAKIVVSKTDFKRLAAGKSIEDLKTGENIIDFRFAVTRDLDLRVGSHRFIKIRVK